MATKTNLEMYRGEDVEINYTISPVVDITGWVIKFTVSRARNAAVKIIASKTCTIVSGAAGTFKATLAAADTADVDPGMYFWDVTRTDSGSIRVLGFGDFTITGVARLPT